MRIVVRLYASILGLLLGLGGLGCTTDSKRDVVPNHRPLTGDKSPGQFILITRDKTGSLTTTPDRPFRVYVGLNDTATGYEEYTILFRNESGSEVTVVCAPMSVHAGGAPAGFNPPKLILPDKQNEKVTAGVNTFNYDRLKGSPRHDNYVQYNFGYRILIISGSGAKAETLDVDPEMIIEGRP